MKSCFPQEIMVLIIGQLVTEILEDLSKFGSLNEPCVFFIQSRKRLKTQKKKKMANVTAKQIFRKVISVGIISAECR
jgi:hypothetical protein